MEGFVDWLTKNISAEGITNVVNVLIVIIDVFVWLFENVLVPVANFIGGLPKMLLDAFGGSLKFDLWGWLSGWLSGLFGGALSFLF